MCSAPEIVILEEPEPAGYPLRFVDIPAMVEKNRGIMPCNLTAFILGFVLKEYANTVYSYSDNMTTDTLDTEKLATMISEVIKQENTPDKEKNSMRCFVI